VWAKKQAEGAVAVLFLNADNVTQDLSVDLEDLGFKPNGPSFALTARDIWEKRDLPAVAGSERKFTVAAVPPQDSRFIVFKPQHRN
jgi:hypothetical protein